MTLTPKERRRAQEKIAAAFRVPYWILGLGPRPSWFRRPVWRWRARQWRRSG